MRFLRPVAIALMLAAAPETALADEYFLDGAQKVELLMQGRITGRDGAQYDVWLVPGYAPPSRHIGKGWRAAGEDLKTYRKPEYYRKAGEIARKTMRYARRDLVAEYAFAGSSQAWREASADARRRVDRRVFGWWLAWPWALVEASAESVWRVGVGVPGGAAVWLGGAAGVPVGTLVYPAAMSAGHALGEGTALPLAAAGWNTVVAPPLALAGQQPSPERADGWWMTRLRDPAEDDIRGRFVAWQQGWQSEPELAGRRAEVVERTEAHQAVIAGLQAALAAEQKAWASTGRELSDAYQQMALQRALAALPALQQEMAAQGYSPARLEAMQDLLREELVKQGMDRATADRVLAGLTARNPATPPEPARREGNKTDPLKQVLERAP